MSSIAMAASASALDAQRTAIEILANDIANKHTYGYKAMRVVTSDLFYNTLKKAGIQENADATARPVALQVGSGAKIEANGRILTQGALQFTDNSLDIALSGPGYFAIAIPTYPNGRGFTRHGSFHIDANTRQIVTANGEPLLDTITVPQGIEQNTIMISANGMVTATDPATNQQIDIGQLTLYTFPNENGLEARGNNMYIETGDGSGEAVQIVDLTNKFIQKNLEMSNVSVTDSMIGLIDAQRNYELALRFIKAIDEMEKENNNLKG